MKPLTIELEQEEDGRWIAEIPAQPGLMVYGETKLDAVEKLLNLADSLSAEPK